jgi:DNA-binding transcriptional ArsR family regulator
MTTSEPTPTARFSDSDPERIRALAHPLRLRLLDLLDAEGDLTATECAARTGESVAGCSFHLHQLAKYGYVEAAPRRGREKPWRSVRTRDSRYDPAVPGSLRAVSEMARLTVSREADRLHRWLDTAHDQGDEWLLASNLTVSTFWATSEELLELSEQVQRLTDRFAGRSEDPSLRPPGARHARLFGAVTADDAP